MCKKSKFPLVFNIFLAFFITLVVTIFVKAGEGALTPRYGTHLLNQHENCKGAEEGGEDHTGIAVDQAQPIHDHKERDHGHLCGDHHGGQVELEQ